MSNYVGIDLGTTFSAVAYIDESGRPAIINNDRDDNITPSCVAKIKGEIVVGRELDGNGEMTRKTPLPGSKGIWVRHLHTKLGVRSLPQQN